jgi:hypothetical protein
MNNKLGIVVPYRNRYEQLLIFKKSIISYLKNKDIDFELIIVEQDNAKEFNRGKLLNVGFTYAKKFKCNYVVFHDIDMLPVDVDYSYSDIPLQLANNFISEDGFSRLLFDEYFGGVTMFSTKDFETINGYSNEYWGWGYEDNDLLFRCKQYNLPLELKEFPSMGGNTAALKLNGENAFVEFKNVIEPTGNYTIFISFYPDDINCKFGDYDDTYSVFTIPGLDLSINYNSYGRYNFEIYNEDEEIIYINSDIKPNYKTNICVTIDSDLKEIKMFQDGILIGHKKTNKDFYNYRRQSKSYIGVGNPNRCGTEKWYRGLFNTLTIFDNILSENEITEISNNKFLGITQNFGNYNSSEHIKLSYDAKFIKNYKLIDLSGKGNDGKITNCEIVGYLLDDTKKLSIPYRRESTFKLIPHEENGFVNGAWKSGTTRFNQLRYFNEVVRGHKPTKEDGLSNLEFKEHSNIKIENQTHINVSI